MRIELTNECNLKCTYCHAKPNTRPGIISLGLIKEAIDKGILDNRIGQVTISGGEPFLYPEIIYEVVQFLIKNGFTIIRIQTNGTLITKELLQPLKPFKKEVSFRVSIDGHTPLINDFYRGGFKDVVKGIKALVEEEFITEAICMLTIANYPWVDELIEFCESLGIKSLQFRKCIGVGIEIVGQEHIEIANRTILKSKSKIVKKEPWYLVKTDEGAHICPTRIGILTDGRIFPCGCIPDSLGSLSETKSFEDLRNHPVLKLLQAKKYPMCPARMWEEIKC